MARKENGEYLLLSKFDEEVVFEYHITIRDEDFNLGILTMRTPEGVFEADFDALRRCNERGDYYVILHGLYTL